MTTVSDLYEARVRAGQLEPDAAQRGVLPALDRLVRDLGEALGCGAHVAELRRLWVDPFRDPRMWTLDELQALAERGDIGGKIGRTAMLHDLTGVTAPRVLVIGLGDAGKFFPSDAALDRWLRSAPGGATVVYEAEAT